MSLCYLCCVVLTFDQSASVICFSPLAACEQELYKHVLPPREANGSLLITGEAGRREAHSHCCCFIPLSGSRPDTDTCTMHTCTLTHMHKHTTGHLAGGAASRARCKIITELCEAVRFDVNTFYQGTYLKSL